MEKIVEKINDTKHNRIAKMSALNYNKNMPEHVFIKKFNICKRTLKKWKGQMEVLKKLNKVTMDRALKELIFNHKSQILCFEYLKKDLNLFCTYDEVNKEIPITRYYYKIVKQYILDELKNV